MEFLRRLFSSDGYMPHGHCYMWQPGLVWLHVISDALTALAYTSIPFALLYFVRRRKDLPFNWMFLCFGVFIVACGATHAMEIWTLWTPVYWLSGAIKAVTAVTSVLTAILLARLLPKALAIPTAQQLSAAHQELRRAHEVLESRVQERTAELTRKNQELANEIIERKRGEDAIRESEARKTAVMEVALDGIIVMDHEGKIVELNRAAETIFRLERSHAVGKSLGDLLVPEASREKHRLGLAHYLKTGEGPIIGKRIEVSALRSDGTEFPAEVAIVATDTGAMPTFTGYVRDITERKRASEALRISEARFRRLFESGMIGIVLGDVDGRIDEANDGFLEIVGYSRADLEAGILDATVLNAPGWKPAQDTARAQLAERGFTQPWEKELVRKDGSRVPVLIGVTMLDAPNCLNVVLDLTEQKRSEQAVRRLAEQRDADARFRGLLEAAPDAMVIVDQEGAIAVVNIQAERLFGYPREELLGKSVDLLLPDRLRGAHAPHRAAYFQEPKVREMGSGFDLLARRKDGSEFPVEIGLSPLTTKDGVLVSSAIRDITARKQGELELRRARDVAENASRELEAFSYSVAHDLRAPLRGLNGYSIALIEDHGPALDAQAREYLQRISAGAVWMGQLIDALLGLSRVSRTELSREQVDLTATANAVIAALRTAEPDRVVEFSVAEGLAAAGDAKLLRLLLDNLLGNAWKFVSKRDSAVIQFDRDADGSFFVRDNGAGFDMAYAQKLFEPFQRLHKSSDFAGTGIGLATVHRIVRRHGGKVWAEGTVDGGATFHFTLEGGPDGGMRK